MTAPMRRYLLNKQIAIESRRIAHVATKTCKFAFDGTDHDDEHTGNCNKLKRAIETLALQVKLAALQPVPVEREEAPPLFEQEEADDDAQRL
jgi:hypothetical protein